MKLTELQKIIESEGLKTGVDTESNSVIVMAKGYRKIGEINYRKPFDVILNLDSNNQQYSKESLQNIYQAIFVFISTPIEERL